MRWLRHAFALFAFALALGFAFQGSRGLWEPDEGRYAQVSMQMLRSGDWLMPRRHGERIHPTKPPLTYWAIAASTQVFGRNEWAVRAPNALAFAFTALSLFAIGRRLTPALPGLAAAIYASTALPFLAANLVTTDTLLTLWTTLMVQGYVGLRWWPPASGPPPLHLKLLLWLACGLAFLTKGPPALLPLLALILFDLTERDWRTRELFDPRALLLFAVVAFSWYAAVALRHPGLLEYLFRDEFVRRIGSDHHGHFPEWWGGLYVYGLTLLLGLLPWGAGLLASLPAQARRLAGWRGWTRETRLLACWILLPLTVLLFARSRLPLYLLPLFPALALLVAASWLGDRARLVRRLWMLPLAALALLALKLWAAGHPHDKDARAFTAEIRRQVDFAPQELVFVDVEPRYGLGFYFDVPTARTGLGPPPRRGFDLGFVEAIARPEGRLFLVRPASLDDFRRRVRETGAEADTVGSAHRLVLVRVRDDD